MPAKTAARVSTVSEDRQLAESVHGALQEPGPARHRPLCLSLTPIAAQAAISGELERQDSRSYVG